MPQKIDHLVVLGSTLTALSLARHCHSLGLDCDVVDSNAGPATFSVAAKATLIEGSLDQEVLESVTALARIGRSALIADSDSWLRWVARFRMQLEQAFERIIHPTNETISACLDKSDFLEWCNDTGLPAPKLYPIPDSNRSENIPFPVMVRPRETLHGTSSTLPKAAEIRCGKDLGELLDRYNEEDVAATVCESLLRPRMRQFSVGLARNAHCDIRAIVAEKIRPPPAWCAGGTYVIAEHVEDVHDLAVSAANRMDFFGIAEIEILKDEDTQETFLIEINPRPWVQYSLAWRSGFDFLTFILSPQDYRPEYEETTGRRWISFRDDLYVALSRSRGMVKMKEMKLWRYVSDLLKANVFAYWAVGDIRPWFQKISGSYNNRKIRR